MTRPLHTSLRTLAMTVLALAVVLVQAIPATAQDYEQPRGAFSQIFHDGISGGAVGGLVGLALLAFVDTPSDNLHYITTSAAVGVLAGVGFGVWKTTRTPAYLRPAVRREDGRWHVAVPQPELVVSGSSLKPASQATVLWRLAGVRF